jgi:hypothetical protein
MDPDGWANAYSMNLKYPTTHTLRLISLILAAFLLSACAGINAGLPGKPPQEAELGKISDAKILLATLETENERLKTFKGIGKIRVYHHGKIQIDQRVAWLGFEPDNLSIAVLISGYPAIKVASDGKWFYYLEAQGDQTVFKKVPATNANLKRIISIAIPCNDVLTLLAGRAPIRTYNAAYLNKDESGSGYVLVLKKRWWGIIEKIYYDQDKSHVRQIEIFNRAGALIYRAIFEEMQNVQGYQVPLRLKISNEDGASVELNIDRYWADVDVSPSMFVLTPPD